jgi:hypothetical protein
MTNDEPCSWIADDVCSNPVCDAALNDDLVGRVAEQVLAELQSGCTVPADAALRIVQLTARCVGGHFALEEMEAEQAAFEESADDEDEEPQAVCADHE